MKKILIYFTALLIAACASTGDVPAWKDKAWLYLEDYKSLFLAGKEDAAEPHFVKATREMAAGNDVQLLMTAYLTKCALHAASLERFETADFARAYRLEPNPAQMAYCHFLKGNFSAVDLNVLPARYAGIVKAATSRNAAQALRELGAIDDPLSRLVACGVWVNYLPYDESILQLAISTASANGWRRPLWAYLETLQAYYLERGDISKAEAVKLRMDVIRK